MGIFKKSEIVALAFRVPEEFTIDFPTPMIIPKNDWLVKFADDTIEHWTNADFRAEWLPVDADAKRELG